MILSPLKEAVCDDRARPRGSGLATVRVQPCSGGLHPKTQNHPTHGTRRPHPIVRGTLALVEVAHFLAETVGASNGYCGRGGMAPTGSSGPGVALAIVRERFDLEHTFRFLKQTLGWTTPRVRRPEQADLWTWLVLASFAQLRLARACVEDRRLPWERRYDPGRLTPLRVRRAVSSLLPELGTPAKPPKPCGRSPGRPKGRRSGRAERHPALKKTA